MLETFSGTTGSLTTRLLAALDAAETAGGDLRGRQSAAILVVPPEGEAWRTVVSLRVEDHPDPLPELHRLVALARAYRLAGEADELTGDERFDEAGELYQRAAGLAPDNDELRFWAGLSAAQAGDLDAGVEQVRAAIAEHQGWLELLRRLSPRVAPAAAAVRARLEATHD